MSCACDRSGDAALEGLLHPPLQQELRDLLLAMAIVGGRPGTAVIVLTDRANARWFYPAGVVLPGLDALPVVILGRRLDEVAPRVRAECPACAARLVDTPRDRIPVYLRIDAPPQCAIGSVPFPPRLFPIAEAAHGASRGTQ